MAQLIRGTEHDLGGGFVVNRVLPVARARNVGPFFFFDHFGPVTVRPEMNIDVRPHPHIGLATITYLFEGSMMHRDSIGTVQRIEAGEVNLMSAGSGIVHSERTPEDLRDRQYELEGLQLWLRLPPESEDAKPTFSHLSSSSIPEFRVDSVQARLIFGSAFGHRALVQTPSPALFMILSFAQACTLEIPPIVPEMAIYPPDKWHCNRWSSGSRSNAHRA